MFSFPFLRLPQEIRDLIYEHYLASCGSKTPQSEPSCRNNETLIAIQAKERTLDDDSLYSQFTWHASLTDSDISTASFADLLLVNKQIFSELTAFFWHKRTLYFRIDKPAQRPRNREFQRADRIAAILCIREYLLDLAKRNKLAIQGLTNIEVEVHGSAHEDMREIRHILSETRSLLTNWRSPRASTIKCMLHLDEVFKVPMKKGSLPPRVLTCVLKAEIDFHLACHDPKEWKREVDDVLAKVRQNFRGWSKFDEHVFESGIVRLQRALQRGKEILELCSRQTGCHCDRHLGRTLLSMERYAGGPRTGCEKGEGGMWKVIAATLCAFCFLPRHVFLSLKTYGHGLWTGAGN